MATQNTNASTTFMDIISNSVLIRSGSPDVYQLKPKEETFATLKRKTVGQKDPNKTNKTVLLVGETGAGKSAVIDALLNYMMGVKFEDDVWFEVVEREKEEQLISQTSDVIVYQIFGFEANTLPYSLTIIDTPGYGDTRGIEHDVIIREQLFDLFTSGSGVHAVDAVALVVKATDNRLSDRLTYVINSVTSLFGKDLEKNILALITHSDGRKPKNVLKMFENLKVKCAINENEPLHFLFNNCQHEDRTEDRDYLERDNDISVRGLRQFTEFLGKTTSHKMEKTVEVLNERIRLAACVHNLQDRIRVTELKQREVEQVQEALKKQEEDMKKTEKFTIEVNEVYKEKEAVEGGRRWLIFYKGATCCTVCEETCHYPGCKRSKKPKYCKVMKEGKCTVCTKKCPASAHVKENWRYVIKTRKVKKNLHDVKEKYEPNKTEHEKKMSLEENLKEAINKLTTEKKRLLEESYQHVVSLEQIALNVDSLSTHVHLDFLIEKMKETGDTEKVQKLEEMRSRQDEGTRAALRYMFKAAEAQKNSNIPAKYKDIISNSVLIRSRSPAVYQLKPKEETSETLKRKTVGEKDLSKTNKTILLVGEIGAGKSTLLNALLNYTMGVKFEDDVWFEIVEKEEEKTRWESQTPDVIVYQMFGFEANPLPYSLTIIDTPGYGDTSKKERDAISQRLVDLFTSDSGVHELDAVALVMKASDNRLSDRLMYVFDSVVSLFGEDLDKNIVALITHSDGRKPKNALQALKAAKVKCAINENEPLHFLFNNCQHEDRTEDRDYLEHANNISVRGLRQFTEFLEKSAPEKVKTTVTVLNEHKRLAACVHDLQERVRETELKQREVEQKQEALKKQEEDMRKTENFTIEVDEVYKEKEAVDGGRRWLIFYKGATCCTVCEETCHYPGCTWAPTPKYCEVMKKGRCTVCTNKCPASAHVKEKWIHVTKTRKVTKNLHDVEKNNLEPNKTQHEDKLILENLEEAINKLTTEKKRLLEESYQHVVSLEQIALNVDSLSTHVHLDFLIEKMKETGDTEKVQKLEEMRSRQDEGTRAALRYAQ